jgi:cardiolipin synthase
MVRSLERSAFALAGREKAEMSQPELPDTTGSQPHIAFLASGSDPARQGNMVHPLVDSAPAFRRICAAIETATHSVWLTAAFVLPESQMPDGRGSLFDFLDRAVERGLDVCIVFWRPNGEMGGYGQMFLGSPADREVLRARFARPSACLATEIQSF